MTSSLSTNENLTCDECGHFGAIDFGERKLCPDCYEGCGSCCPEFGKEAAEQDDLAGPVRENISMPSTPSQ